MAIRCRLDARIRPCDAGCALTMPILPVEPDCYPSNLWEEADSLPLKAEGTWWCLHTKPRQEKATARDLREHGVTYYLPQVVKESRTPRGRKLKSVVPLFAGYL